jgi:hypothetical protein
VTAFRQPPPVAAWQHRDARAGFEVVFLHVDDGGYRVEGRVAAVEAGEVWAVEYAVALDRAWRTRRARVRSTSASGRHQVTLEADGAGGWTVDGAPAPLLEGCLDVDLEASSATNAFPVRRLSLEVGQEADAPAAYVRAPDPRVERLEQRYARKTDGGGRPRYHYVSPAFDFEAELVYDEFGLVLDYPGIASRMA